ncbi:IclR family transcriptional regulator [Brevibacillus centrosporus]|uniref:Transcriptional regulator, IclR family n=1 Tax=Brevibacillus centrosporus TaxID=54910 RepID=A0A1I4C451_9BACL|nr:IclR family transcriptional regulator [Brevibacillus centrosporus]MEC2128865.1 IclR family transcriptional regulator [Brevibacillus centrosporus]MED4907629.1 IclR family transcriptional regulator [Brevibacillus centrosporus]RNB67089.1 IclR family transcriptional regulator [Brevibacillus centrosporus]SFK74966.1 transcriptional regulator, IclR family [Brevibacillus centrosporus]GED33756.1 IclR family transcriptional regulator [Brevibacillus centrosporus]
MVQSIERTMKIIRVLISDEKQAWPISDLASATGLPISTLHRFLDSMIQYGLVEQEPVTKHYKAGYTWMEIGFTLHNRINFRYVARPIMEELAQEVEESIFLSVPAGYDSIPIEKVESPLKIRIDENMGERIPLTIGAPNKAILAHWKPEEVRKVVAAQLAPALQQPFLDQLAHVKETGYAISCGEKTEGTVAVAAPIFSYGNRIVAALSINAPSFRVTEDRMSFLIERVKQKAATVSAKIGGV